MIRTAAVAAGLVGASQGARAAVIDVTADITTSTTWTANNTYNLKDQIYVEPGASLTIEAGTVIASDGGSLAIAKGAQIFACGDKDNPIIFTSTADVATWDVDGTHPTGRDPKTGEWREGCEEWGNVTIMGGGLISENATAGNVATCDPDNVAFMEGLEQRFVGDTAQLYGGGDDDDDSGIFKYVSLRYGGKVLSIAVELNGLSLGGVGRETDIHHVEIMNNVDDGIEIWGGCVKLKCISIWNVGDDSFDVDQGWRGCAQFVLIVQGYSCDADQGSGVGDNCFETDGAEDSDWQPVTTAVIYNATAIGQPSAGDHGTAWRDNARVQYRNCIFMDLGEQLVKFDNVDGDGGSGYGHNGTLSWANTWTTSYTATSTVNPCANPGAVYKAQFSGKLAEMKDSIFFRNQFASAYTEAAARGVFDPASNNVLIPGFDPADKPIMGLTRGPAVTKGGKTLLPVTFLDPRPIDDPVIDSVEWAPEDGFFCSAPYRGAFAPGQNWLCNWTASQAYGFTPSDGCQWCADKKGLAGVNGDPVLYGTGDLIDNGAITIELKYAKPSSITALIIGFSEWCTPFKGGYFVPSPDFIFIGIPTDANGELSLGSTWPVGVPQGSKV